jgi:tRNA uridine 5-carboxymethylaminomethyl modification enzyme
MERIVRMDGNIGALAGDERVCEQVQIEVKYEGYIRRQQDQVEKFRRSEDKKIPSWLDYRDIPELRHEAKEKLAAVRPLSIGQACRISGISPADVSILLVYVEGRLRRRRSGARSAGSSNGG